jgi:hypothetical protein
MVDLNDIDVYIRSPLLCTATKVLLGKKKKKKNIVKKRKKKKAAAKL